MESQTQPRGVSSVAWIVIGIVTVVVVAGALVTLVAMMFGLDVGGVLS